jgi:HPr kinase/phosphorylase
MSDATLVHGTAVSVDGRAVVIRGPSGSGKSDLALRTLAVAAPLIAHAVPVLVADDQVIVERCGPDLRIRAPDALRGLLEVRGLGIVTLPSVATAELTLFADIVAPAEIVRLPDLQDCERVHGIDVPIIRIAAFEPSAPLKLLLALATARLQPAGPERA